MNLLRFVIISFLLLFAVNSTAAVSNRRAEKTEDGREEEKQGVIINSPEAYEGYTLFCPEFSRTTYLIDMEGRLVNKWESEYTPGHSAYLLENGNLLRAGSIGPGNSRFHGGGSAGLVQEFTWEGELVWDFNYSGEDYRSHHDIERLANGNVLIIAWESKTEEEAIAAGRDPELVGEQGLWPDYLVEVKPAGKTGGEIVWEWHVWDHLVQDLDPRKDNYGSVEEHPELININPSDWSRALTNEDRGRLETLGYLSRGRPRGANPDWIHTNSVAYNAELDQIVLSVLGFNEIWIIDHSTTTKEAAGHTGGKYGKGGDLLYRWGNPAAYKAGTREEQKLFAQHDADWIDKDLPGGGNLIVFNNGRGRAGGNYSSVDEIEPPVEKDGSYKLKKGKAYGPKEAVWSYSAEDKKEFFSTHVSGAQRLPNGNTLICSGDECLIFEVTAKGKVVWKYSNPVHGTKPIGPGGFGGPGGFAGPGRDGRDLRPPPKEFLERIRKMGPPPGGQAMPWGGMRGDPFRTIFRAYRYGADYAGLNGRELKAGKRIEEMQAE